MKYVNRSIFRAEALRHYIQRREKAVLPRLVSPRTLIFLWILFGLLVAAGFVAWFAKIPVYTSGPAVVVDWKDESHQISQDVVLVAFLPAEDRSRLGIGQSMFLRFNPMGERLSRSIIAVESEVISPDDVQKRFLIKDGKALAITQPSTIAIAQLEPFPADLPVSAYIGSVYPVDVEVGSHRVISLLPFIGQLFGG